MRDGWLVKAGFMNPAILFVCGNSKMKRFDWLIFYVIPGVLPKAPSGRFIPSQTKSPRFHFNFFFSIRFRQKLRILRQVAYTSYLIFWAR